MGKDSGNIGLSELLPQIRRELLEAESQVEPGKGILKVENVELDLSFVTEKSAEGGIKLWVVNLGGKYDAQATHSVKLNLLPVRPIEAATE